MPIRDLLLTKISKEILGPRDGLREKIYGKDGKSPPDPSDEYVIGVLEPKDVKRTAISHFGSTGIFSSQVVNRMDETEELIDEDDDSEGSPSSAMSEITPELDPRALPKSVGISFVVKCLKQPQLSFCVTWARYKRHSDFWERVPFSFVMNNVAVDVIMFGFLTKTKALKFI